MKNLISKLFDYISNFGDRDQKQAPLHATRCRQGTKNHP